MIGAIGEAKKKTPPDTQAGKTEAGATPAAKADPGPATDSKPNAKLDSQLKTEPKPKPEVEHATTDTHES